jgi:hypothetical protein
MFKRLSIIGSVFALSISVAAAQAPSPDAMNAARSLVATMHLTDQYKAVLPEILLRLKPVLVQDRPEIERDYDAVTASVAGAWAPYYTAMVDGVAALYASNFTASELHDIEAFYRLPAGQKFMEKSQALAQQRIQIVDDAKRKATDDLRARLSELLRAKGHKL